MTTIERIQAKWEGLKSLLDEYPSAFLFTKISNSGLILIVKHERIADVIGRELTQEENRKINDFATFKAGTGVRFYNFDDVCALIETNEPTTD